MMKKTEVNNCDNYAHQTSRTNRSLDGPMIDALDIEESKFEKLPSKCLQHILSFLSYEKVSEIREVCKTLNEIGKKVLNKEHRKLERQLRTEIEQAVKSVLFTANIRSSYDMLCFLNGLWRSINNCTISYSFYADYFVAGKLLDEANYLLKDFSSSTIVPYFLEHVCDQKLHLLLGTIVEHSKKAHRHFNIKILGNFIYYDGKADSVRDNQNDLEADKLVEQNEIRITKTDLLNNRRQKINCGILMSKEFLKLILKLNENVLDLTQRVKKVDKKVEDFMNIKAFWNKGQSNCFHQASIPSNSELRTTKVMARRLNLGTLPSHCIQNIVSYFNCDKMVHLRMVSKSFNEVCKLELHKEFEKLKQKLKFKIQYNEKCDMHYASKLYGLKTNMKRDLLSLMQLWKNIYKWHLGTNYYLAAGKVLDEANRLYNAHFVLYAGLDYNFGDDLGDSLDDAYKSRPHYFFLHLMDLVYKAIAHYKFNIVPKYFPWTQKQNYVPDFIVTGDVTNLEKECQLNLEEIEKLIEETDVKINKQNDNNRKFLRIVCSLKKKVYILNREISEKINVLKQFS